MKAYMVQFDGGSCVVIAESFAAAVKKWRAAMTEEFGSDWDETDEPESVALLSDEVIQ